MRPACSVPRSAWRAAVATTAAAGLALAIVRYDVWWTALSQLTSLAVAVGYLALALRSRPGTRGDDAVRGGLACAVVLVAVGFWSMPQTDPTAAYSVLEHGVTPALVLLDVVVVDRLRAVRRFDPVGWLVLPVTYLGWYLAADLGTYPALDPAAPAALAGRLGALAVLVLLTSVALVVLARTAPPSPLRFER